MTAEANHWTKTELHIYVLLLCANADADMSDEEINLIKAKTDADTFQKIFDEFINDSEDESLDKIGYQIEFFEYSHPEVANLKKEMHQIFFADDKFTMLEQNLDRILDNIIY